MRCDGIVDGAVDLEQRAQMVGAGEGGQHAASELGWEARLGLDGSIQLAPGRIVVAQARQAQR